MEHQRVLAVQQQLEQLCKAWRVVVHEAAVGVLHQLLGMGGREVVACSDQGAGALHHGGLDDERMAGNARPFVGQVGAFHLAPEVRAARELQAMQHVQVRRAEAGQVVSTEQRAPAHAPAIQARVATEVSEVGGAVQADGARGRRGGSSGGSRCRGEHFGIHAR